MSEKGGAIEKRLAELKRLAEEAEKARVKLEEAAQKARKEAETIIPKIQAEVADIDKQITALQQKRAGLLEQLKLLGLKVKGARKGGARAGGVAEKLKELMRSVGVGGVITNADIYEYLGTHSGYVGMVRKAQEEAGNLQRIGPGTYKVTGIPT